MMTEIHDTDLIIPARFGSDFLVDDPDFDLHNTDEKLPSLVLTRTGNIFDGIIRQAFIGDECTGFIYNAERFDDCSRVHTSEIVDVGVALPFGGYIETVSGSRYLVSALCKTVGATHWVFNKARAIAEKPHYFGPKQWSRWDQSTDGILGGATQ